MYEVYIIIHTQFTTQALVGWKVSKGPLCPGQPENSEKAQSLELTTYSCVSLFPGS